MVRGPRDENLLSTGVLSPFWPCNPPVHPRITISFTIQSHKLALDETRFHEGPLNCCCLQVRTIELKNVTENADFYSGGYRGISKRNHFLRIPEFSKD